MSDDTIKPVDALIPQATDELAMAVETHQRNIPYLIKYQQLQAKVTWQKYKALIDQGFTLQEAFELCKEKT